jgi:hypothetical protein
MSLDEVKFCPACRMGIDSSAKTCVYCGIPLEVSAGGTMKTMTTTYQIPKVHLPSTAEIDAVQENDVREIPEMGLAVYHARSMTPFAVRLDTHFIIGRKTDGGAEDLLDMTLLDGYIMGVSKQHVRIQLVGSGYQITDLGSMNGTWVNEVRLVANQPAILPNAARVRLGQMELYFTYRLKGS